MSIVINYDKFTECSDNLNKTITFLKKANNNVNYGNSLYSYDNVYLNEALEQIEKLKSYFSNFDLDYRKAELTKLNILHDQFYVRTRAEAFCFGSNPRYSEQTPEKYSWVQTSETLKIPFDKDDFENYLKDEGFSEYYNDFINGRLVIDDDIDGVGYAVMNSMYYYFDSIGHGQEFWDSFIYQDNEKIQEKIIIENDILKALGYDENSPEAQELLKDMETFAAENPENIDKLSYWLSKIPENYSEYANSCKWNNAPRKVENQEGAKYEGEWFNIDGTNFHFTRIIDGTTNYPLLSSLMNVTYCYNLVNNIKNWDSKYVELLGKRAFIDVVVSDYASDAGAAYYMGGNPYSDYIYLPTKMGDESIYDGDSTYNYMINCLVHEMSHYLDGVCGIVQSKDLDMQNDAYDLAEKLMNEHVVEIQTINHHGVLPDNEKEYFQNFHIGKVNPVTGEVDSFCEAFAELMRADLVDHDKFVQVIGKNNYDKLFNYLKASDNVDNENIEIVYGDNNSLAIINHDNDERIIYDGKGNLLLRERSDGSSTQYKYDQDGNEILMAIYDSNHNLAMKWEDEYDENGNKISSITTRGDGSSVHYKYDDDGKEVLSVNYDENNNMIGTKETKYDEEGYRISSMQTNRDGSSVHCKYNKEGKILLMETYDKGNNIISKIETEYDEEGSITAAIATFDNGQKIRYEYKDGEFVNEIKYENTTSSVPNEGNSNT